TTGKDALVNKGQVAVLDQSVPPNQRLELVKPPRRDEIRVFLMTSSGARGVSFPKTDWIIAAIPRFNIEAALMEVAQLIYRGRGMYPNPETGMEVSGDHKDRRLVMLINDFIIEREDIDRKRQWLRQSSDLLTLLVMLRSTIHTRIKGDAGLNKNRIAFVPVGSVGDEELLRLMSDDVLDFLREAKVFIRDSHSQESKSIVG
ncbi:MAG: helicase-related protein, partial [Nostoc sp.]